MAAFWLTFKPLGPDAPKGWPREHLADLVARFRRNPEGATEWWRIASYRTAKRGDRVYLFKQGKGSRGIFGVGTIGAGPELRNEPNDQETGRYRVNVRFESLVDPGEDEFLLRLEEIEDVVPATLIDAMASGVGVDSSVEVELERRLAGVQHYASLASDQADDGWLDPESIEDARERAFRAIRLRRGQAAFRAALLAAYGGRCAVTGCAIEDVLEAAHIVPSRGPLTDHVSNGLLLRADIHTLFDCDLLGIDPETRQVVLQAPLKLSTYKSVDGRVLRSPRDDTQGPTRKNLTYRYAFFQARLNRTD